MSIKDHLDVLRNTDGPWTDWRFFHLAEVLELMCLAKGIDIDHDPAKKQHQNSSGEKGAAQPVEAQRPGNSVGRL